MNVGELRAILADERIPNDADVRIEIVDKSCLDKHHKHHWTNNVKQAFYVHDNAFWLEGVK